MIVVREVFSIDPEQMKAAKEWAREERKLAKKLGFPESRVMTDFTGEFYTLVLEGEFVDFASFQKAIETAFANPEWQALYGRMRKAIRGGRREVYTLVE